MILSYEEFVNEAKVQVKRKYTESYPAKHVYASTRIRNAILDSVKDGVVSKEDFKKMIQDAGASESWVRKYSGFFKMNEKDVRLSSAGIKIWKGLRPVEVSEASSDKVTLNVTVSNIDQSTADDFLKMFSFMEWCGNVGTGRTMRAYFDGDGHFRPSIKVEGVDLKKIDLGLDDKDREIDLDLGFGA
jgi:hypothetical protein